MERFPGFHRFSGFSNFTLEDLLRDDPPGTASTAGTSGTASTSGTPGTTGTSLSEASVQGSIPSKKRGRPRKVAIEGEEQRRKQTTTRKRKKRKPDSGELPRPVRIRFVGDNVNTKKVYLPEGWKAFATKRSSGLQKGSHDLIYLAPTGDRIRSRNDLFKWVREYKSDIDPLKFLFTRTLDILLSEENAKSIIFRNAGLKGRHGSLLNVRDKTQPPSSTSDTCNTIFTERGKELLLDEGMEYESDMSLNPPELGFQGEVEGIETTPLNEEQTSSTPKKLKVSPKPRRIPLDKTLVCLKSPYFALKNQIPVKPVSMHAIHSHKWIPPRSPYNLIQEDLYHDPWKLLIATIFLNCTTGKLAIPVIHEFLARWPSPHEACSASLLDIVDVVDLLGLGRTRAATIIRFSHEYLTVDWKKPTELFGIGKYGNDSYKVFCLGQWRTVDSEDKYLNLYINWLWNACSKSSSSIRS